MSKSSSELGAISKKVVIIVAGVSVLVIALFAFVISAGSGGSKSAAPQTPTTAREAADLFLTTIIKRDSKDSYAMFSKDQKNQVSAISWKNQVEGVFRNYGKRQPTFISVDTLSTAGDNITPTSQNFTYELTFDKLGKDTNVTYTMNILVVQESNLWKIGSYNTIKP